MSIHAKNKGNKFELDSCRILHELGYTAVSARSESKRLDDLGCDIVDNSPYSIQCKAVERLNMSNHALLNGMKDNGLPMPVVFHKRNRKGVVVTMLLEDWLKMVKQIKRDG